jgi:hypothetical protein
VSEFTDWKDDQSFIHAEAVKLTQDVIAVKVLWLQPPGKRSTRVSVDVPTLSEDKRTIEQRNMVYGWKCQRCAAVLFGTCINDLKHSPCCDGYQWHV